MNSITLSNRGKATRSHIMNKDKNTAAILALLIGYFGVHRFYLNQSGLGILYIVLTLVTCGLFAIVPIVDGILFLIMSDEEFQAKYNPHQPAIHVHVHPSKDRVKVAPPQRESIPRRTTPIKKVKSPIVKHPPAQNNPYKLKGLNYFRDFRFEHALKEFQRSLNVKYDDKAVHFNIACCYSMMEDVEKSIFHLDQAVKFGFVNFKKIHKHDSLAYTRAHDEFDEFVKAKYRISPSDDEIKGLEMPKENLLDQQESNVEEQDLLEQLRRQQDFESLLAEDEFLEELEVRDGKPRSFVQKHIGELFGEVDKRVPDESQPLNHDDDINPISETNLTKLKELGELRDKGILTEEEFQAQKRKLLG